MIQAIRHGIDFISGCQITLRYYVGAHKLYLYRKMVEEKALESWRRAAFRWPDGQWMIPSEISTNREEHWSGFSLELLKYGRELRRRGELPDEESIYDEAEVILPSFDLLIDAAVEISKNTLLDPTAFVSPRLWTPRQQDKEKEFLKESAIGIIKELQEENRDLESIRWNVFEELVAEILRKQGMEIHLVTESPQGGRDIIARGELIPGIEPLTIAVEVKHRRTVARPEVQWQHLKWAP